MRTSDTAALRALIVRVCRERYEGHAFVYFYGSNSRGEGAPDSDLDITVVFDRHTQPYREAFSDSGYLFDVFVFDAETLHFTIANARAIRHTTVLNIINSSIALPANTPLSVYLSTRARLALAQAPAPANMLTIRAFLTNLLRDLRRAVDTYERNALAVDLYKTLSDVIFMQHGLGGDLRKHYSRALNEIDPAFYQRLSGEFEKTLRTDNAETFIAFAMQLLNDIGGELKEGFKLSLPHKNRLPIALK
jgi:predicted nucleotidyltransferase